MRQYFKSKLLVCLTFLTTHISASYLSTIPEEDESPQSASFSGCRGEPLNESSITEAATEEAAPDLSLGSAEEMLVLLNRKEKILLGRRKKFNAFRDFILRRVERLKHDIRVGVCLVKRVKFPPIPDNIREKNIITAGRAIELSFKLKNHEDRLAAAEDIREREGLESDVSRLVRERDIELEKLRLFDVYEVLPDLKLLLDVCSKSLGSHIQPFVEIVNELFSLVSHYAAAVYDPEKEFGLPVIEALGDSADGSLFYDYNKVAEDLNKILHVIHLVRGWVAMAERYIDLSVIRGEEGVDNEDLDPIDFDDKNRLGKLLKVLSLIMPNLKKMPLHFHDEDVHKGLELLNMNAEIDGLKKRRAIALHVKADAERNLQGLNLRIDFLNQQIFYISGFPSVPLNRSSLFQLENQKRYLTMLKAYVRNFRAAKLLEIQKMDARLGKVKHDLIERVRSIEGE